MVAGGGGWLQGGVHGMVAGGLPGGMHGCGGVYVVVRACMVAGGCVWLLGVCMVAGRCAWLLGGERGCRGHAWLLGGCVWLQEGMHGCGGACVVAGGGCIGYDEIQSMSRRYASYWNAFLFILFSFLKVCLYAR